MEGQKDWQVQPEHSGNLIRLQNLIQRAAGFRLLILLQNRPRYRDGLIAFLGEAQKESRVLNLKELGGFEAFEKELEQGGRVRLLHLINLESLGEKEQQAFFKGLNYHREYIARTCSGILAFWLAEPLVREMALQAADFWAWQEQVLDFTVPVEPVERMAIDWRKISNMQAQGKQERIKEISEVLTHTKQPSLIAADLKRELGSLYESIGEQSKARQALYEAIDDYKELDEVEACVKTQLIIVDILEDQRQYEQALNMLTEQVLPVARQLNSEQGQAVTLGRIARSYQHLGQLDKAFKIHKDEVLPIFEKLGDSYGKATTFDQIADILNTYGQTDNALKIWTHKVLPIFEKSGDLHSTAITWGSIANTFYSRGQLDNALKIYQNRMLPVFEQLGDVKTKAIIFDRIANIFQQRGQIDDALKIREQEELPVFERLGNVRELLLCRTKIAVLLHEIDTEANKERIEELLRLALADARRLKLPKDIALIEGIMKKLGIAANGDGAE